MHGAIRTLDLISAQRCPADSTATGSHLTSHCFCFPFFATFQTKLLLPFGLCFPLLWGSVHQSAKSIWDLAVLLYQTQADWEQEVGRPENTCSSDCRAWKGTNGKAVE